MIYYATGTEAGTLAAMAEGRLGRIVAYRGGTGPTPGVSWGMDNGCFSERWAPGPWWAYAEAMADPGLLPDCGFAVAPDVWGDAAATLARSIPWLPRLRDLGYPAALVAQDGLTVAETPWDDFDVLFLGGSDGFRTTGTARSLTDAALERGKPVHMGRVNSLRRLRAAALWGCSSADGTFLAYAPRENLPQLLGWLRDVNGQPTLI